MRTAIASILGIVLTVGPLQAQQPSRSILAAARVAAAKQPAPQTAARPGMSPAFKWTGIGMLIGGGALLLSGVLVDDACVENGEYDFDFCDDLQTAWVATGAAVAGAGGVVLLIGNSKRGSSPALNFGGKGVTWRFRF